MENNQLANESNQPQAAPEEKSESELVNHFKDNTHRSRRK